VTKATRLHIVLAKGGGQAIRIRPAGAPKPKTP